MAPTLSAELETFATGAAAAIRSVTVFVEPPAANA